MRLFLVRHGETDHNRDSLALGRADVPLNDTGLAQAQAIARALSTEPIVAVYSSPLQRTMRTAEAIARAKGFEVSAENGLIEMDVGELEGLPFSKVRELVPDLAEKWGGPDGPNWLMPGSSERLADVQARAVRTVEGLRRKHRDDMVVAVTHNFVILCVIAWAMGIDLANFRRLRHGVAAITTVDVRPDRARIISLNDTCHLEISE